MDNNFTIYGILKPGSEEVCYIGQSINLQRRIKEHLKSKRYAIDTTKLYNWIRKLTKNNIIPEFKILETVPSRDMLDNCEIKWITSLKPKLNHTSGGTNGRFLIKKISKYDPFLNEITKMLVDGHTIQEIANRIGCTKNSMTTFLKTKKLKTKNSANCKPDGSFTRIDSRRIITELELRKLYSEDLLSCTEISQIKRCSSMAIKAWLKKYGIPVRTSSESMKIRYARGLMAGFRKNKYNKYKRAES